MPPKKEEEKKIKKKPKKFSQAELLEIPLFKNADPHSVLGPHYNKEQKSLSVNAYLPFAAEASVRIKGSKDKIPMLQISPENIYTAVIGSSKQVPSYKICYKDAEGNEHQYDDPYRFSRQAEDIDIYLFAQGNHLRIYEKLGAKLKTIDKCKGVLFTLWAPNAKTVSVAGEFNNWTAGVHPMRKISDSGIWELFIPGLKEGALYKYAVKNKKDEVGFKSDPYAFCTQRRPENASIVSSLKNFKWSDDDWLKARKKNDFKKEPVSIYEVHLASWKRDFENPDFKNEWGFKNYRQLAHEIAEHIINTGYTHVELMPVMEHPLDISWGYQVVNYYAPTSRHGTPEDFMYFVDHMHKNNIGVILDWVPAHFPLDAHGLAGFDGKEIYAYENPARAYHKDWGTLIFDYGRNEVRNFLLANALFWFDKYHADGLRVDAVASMLYLDYSKNEGEWEPNIHGGRENLEAVEFIKKLNEQVHKYFKGGLMIAEESTSWPGVSRPVYLGGLGFDMKWNMGWMHDTLAYFAQDPVYRKFHHNKITFSLWYAFNENFVLPLSHDEVVYGKKSLIEKMPGDQWQKFANLRLYFGFMYGHPGKKLNFMTNDIAQYNEWNCETSLNWEVLDIEFNKKFRQYFTDLQKIYNERKSLYEIDFESRGFQWIDFTDSENSVLSFLRFSEEREEILLFTCNFTPVVRVDYHIGVPEPGYYREIMNSDAEAYGGSGKGNLGGVHSVNEQRFDWQHSIKVTLPPLAVNIYILEREQKQAGLIEEVEIPEPAESEAETETKRDEFKNEIKDDIKISDEEADGE